VALLAGRPALAYPGPVAERLEVAPDVLGPLRRPGAVAEYDDQAANVVGRAELQPGVGLSFRSVCTAA
jgi:hypothetical protein